MAQQPPAITDTQPRPWGRWLALVGGIIALMIAISLFEVLSFGGTFARLEPHFAGSCRNMATAAGVADIRIDRSRGLAYLSWIDAAGADNGSSGSVMLFDLTAVEPRPRPALATEYPGLRPRGMSLYTVADGSRRLFVVNEPVDGAAAVEVFEQSETGAFQHVETIRDPLIENPAAVVAVGAEEFYVANGSSAQTQAARIAEWLLRRGRSTIVQYRAGRTRIVADDAKSAAGIAASADGSTVYVAEALGKRLSIYDRAAGSGDLNLRERVALESMPAALSVATDGSVWIAAQPKGLAQLRRMGDATRPAPTQILRLRPQLEPGDASRVSEVYLDDGTQIAAAAIGARYGSRLLIGSPSDHRLLLCELPASRL